MTPDIVLIANHPGTWRPPVYPDITDTSWQESFAEGNLEQKKNIALCFHWCLAKWQERVSHTKLSTYYLEQYAWLAQVEQMLGGVSDQSGTTIDILKPFSISLEQKASGLAQSIRAAWLGEGADRVAALQDVAKILLDTVRPDGQHVDTGGLRLCHAMLWDSVNDGQTALLETAISVSIICGKKTLDGVSHPREVAWGRVARGWYYLADALMGSGRMDADTDKDYDLSHAIQNTPPDIALRQLLPLLEWITVSDAQDEHGLQYQRRFFIGGARKQASIYSLLNNWFPQLTSHWDSCMLMGLPFEEAVTHAVARLEHGVDTLPQAAHVDDLYGIAS